VLQDPERDREQRDHDHRSQEREEPLHPQGFYK
jgi:hypothetical protein